MSSPHHTSDEENASRDRLLQQFLGVAKREYPEGRFGSHDDGTIAYGVAADPERKIVILDFGGSPVTQLMLPGKHAALLAEKLRKAADDLATD